MKNIKLKKWSLMILFSAIALNVYAAPGGWLYLKLTTTSNSAMYAELDHSDGVKWGQTVAAGAAPVENPAAGAGSCATFNQNTPVNFTAMGNGNIHCKGCTSEWYDVKYGCMVHGVKQQLGMVELNFWPYYKNGDWMMRVIQMSGPAVTSASCSNTAYHKYGPNCYWPNTDDGAQMRVEGTQYQTATAAIVIPSSTLCP